jgi:peptide-methionine (S)-S-oxide reductase
VFFTVAHDPTELNRPTWVRNRSAIFYTSAEQQKIAEDAIAKLTAARAFKKPIVTQVAASKVYDEGYHQNYQAPHDAAVHRLQRPAQDRRAQGAVSLCGADEGE